MSNRELVETLRKLGPEKVLDGMELCPACDSLSPGISIDGEPIMHCPVCHDQGIVSVEAADRWRREMQEKIWQQVKPLARLTKALARLPLSGHLLWPPGSW